VKSGRRFTDKQVSAVATGQIWVGADAVAMGLVDKVGSFDEALARLSSKAPRTEPASPRGPRSLAAMMASFRRPGNDVMPAPTKALPATAAAPSVLPAPTHARDEVIRQLQ